MSDDLRDEALNTSTPAFVSALTLNLVIFGAELAIFTLVRPRFKGVYEPRTFIPAVDRRSAPLSKSILGWPLAVFRADWTATKHQNGLDAYMFIKYLRMMVRIFVPIWLISWLVLLPTTAINTTGGKGGLDQFTFGNITKNEQSRYWAHLLMVYIFTGWILYNIKDEMRGFVTDRQMHLVDPEHSATAQARTVLVTGVPHKFLNERALIRLFSYLPGGIQKVWLNRDLKHMPELYDRRLAASNKLESAETKLISIANKMRRQHEAAVRKGKSPTDEKPSDAVGSKNLADELVPRDQRPTHRLPAGSLPFALPFIGEKVDTIEWCRKEIAETTRELENGRGLLKAEIALAKKTPEGGSGPGRNWKDLKYPPLSSAFILFNQQIAAHMAAQVLTHNMPWRMSDKYTDVAPADVIWSNLSLNPYEQRLRKLISLAATAGLIIAWSIPVTFVGILTNVAGLCKTYSWLAWLCKLPQAVVGILSGVLPPVGLAVLMMFLPIILRMLAKFEGIPRNTGIELSLMTRYFTFQVVHGFLVITLSSGIIKALPDLAQNPTGIPNMLAQNLPGASTFFITYAILQGLSGTAGGMLQIVPLIMHYVKLYILSSTPRSVYALHYDLRDVAWGTMFPSVTLLSVICIAYSVISPIINGFAAVSFFLFYLLHKYMFLYVLDQPTSGDTGGLFFPKAIQHTLVGCYIQQVCLAALFFLSGSIPQGALMIVLVAITALFNMVINDSYGPLLNSLPLTLAHMSFGMPQMAHQEDVQIGHDDDEEEEDQNQDQYSVESHRRLNLAEDLEMQERGKRSPPTGQQPVRDNEAPFDPNEGTHAEGKHNEEPADFDHPAAVEPQRIVWIPADELGLGEAEVYACQEAGVLAGSSNAVMDRQGHVEVHGHPPGVTRNLFSGRG